MVDRDRASRSGRARDVHDVRCRWRTRARWATPCAPSANLATSCATRRIDASSSRASDVDAKRAIHIVDCARCVVEMDASVTCAKVFVERCVECVVVAAGRVVSEHAEIWDCEGCTVTFKSGLGTTQIDQCREVRLEYARRGFMGAVVFATSVGVRVAFGDDGDRGERSSLGYGRFSARGSQRDSAVHRAVRER